jgi:elongation factor G
MNADVPLAQMFGFASELRGLTAGQGEFSMEYKRHGEVPPNEAQEIIEAFKKKNKE